MAAASTTKCNGHSGTSPYHSKAVNEAMIKQVYFPRELFAVTTVGAQLVITALSLFVVIPFLIYFRITPTWTLLLVPVGLILIGMLALGIGLAMACLNVVNRDVEHFFHFLMRAGMFLSPVMWSLEMVPKNRRAILDFIMLNPLSVPITMIRNGLSGMPLHLSAWHVAYSCVVCFAWLVIGTMIFKRYEAQVVKKL
jgi:lipopolysaccharide transport system permease protein